MRPDRVDRLRFLQRLSSTTGIRAIEHAIPIFGPGLAPGHGKAADSAELAGQKLLISFELALFLRHIGDSRKQASLDPCRS